MFQYQKFMERLQGKQTEHYIRQKHKEQDAQCVDSEYTWRKDRIGSIC